MGHPWVTDYTRGSSWNLYCVSLLRIDVAGKLNDITGRFMPSSDVVVVSSLSATRL